MNFSDIKYFTMFVTLNIIRGKSIACRICVAGFFYVCTPLILGATPVWNCNRTTASEVLSNGSVAPFFFATHQIFISAMLNTEKPCLKGNNSTQQATTDSRNESQFPSGKLLQEAWINAMPDYYVTDEIDKNYLQSVRHSIFDLFNSFIRIIVENRAEVGIIDIEAFNHLRSYCDFLEFIESHFQTPKS